MTSPEAPVFDVRATPYAREVEALCGRAEGPVLQVGSRAQMLDRVSVSWRNRFAGRAFVGLDLEPGENVDAVADVTDMAGLRAALPYERFGFILCLHVLEHVRQPWIAAANIEALLAPGGLVFLQVPWVQAYHAFPDDYWRMSLSGLEQLFPGLELIDAFYTGGGSERAVRLVRDGKPDFGLAARRMEAKLLQVLMTEAESRALLKRLREPRLYLSEGFMPVTFINAVARKR